MFTNIYLLNQNITLLNILKTNRYAVLEKYLTTKNIRNNKVTNSNESI